MNSNIGKINEAGYLSSLYKQGFDKYKALNEILANSIDAKASNIKLIIKPDDSFIIDDGDGMDQKEFENMFEMQRSNHSEHKSMGVSGIGGKAASLHLSNNTDVSIYTKKECLGFLKATIPWPSMFKKGKYTGMIELKMIPSNDPELKEFKEVLENCKSSSGTAFKFKTTDDLVETFSFGFGKPGELLEINDNLFDHPMIVFGKFDHVNIEFTDINKPNMKKLMKKYDYFKGDNVNFYTGKKHVELRHYYNKNLDKHMILDPEDNFIKESGKNRFATNVSQDNDGSQLERQGYKKIGLYKLTLGQKIDKKYFDPENPGQSSYMINGNTALDTYTSDMIHDRVAAMKKLSSEVVLYRNNQAIGSFPTDGLSFNSSRAGWESYHKTCGVKAVLEYFPKSSHDNEQDKFMVIQQNKNQWLGSVKKQLNRLISHHRKIKSNEIISYFESFEPETPVLEVKHVAPIHQKEENKPDLILETTHPKAESDSESEYSEEEESEELEFVDDSDSDTEKKVPEVLVHVNEDKTEPVGEKDLEKLEFIEDSEDSEEELMIIEKKNNNSITTVEEFNKSEYEYTIEIKGDKLLLYPKGYQGEFNSIKLENIREVIITKQ